MTPSPLQLAIVLSLALSSACASSRPPVCRKHRGDYCYWPRSVPADRSVAVQYLGNGGVVIQRGEDAIATAPFFSHPALHEVLWGSGAPHQGRIQRMVSETKASLGGVQAILVGHSHYDHAMDVPAIARLIRPDAKVKIWGNDTLVNILHADQELLVESLQPVMARPGRSGEWRALIGPPERPRVRVMAIQSDHSGHLGGIDLLHLVDFWTSYEQETPLAKLPDHPYGYRRGQPLAFLIDFMKEDGTVQFRIHSQDAATDYPAGAPPAELLKEHPIDLAIVCVGASANADRYPHQLVAGLRPRYVLLSHWEWFFDEPTADPEKVSEIVLISPATSLYETIGAMTGSNRVHLPSPGAWFRYPFPRPPGPDTGLSK